MTFVQDLAGVDRKYEKGEQTELFALFYSGNASSVLLHARRCNPVDFTFIDGDVE